MELNINIEETAEFNDYVMNVLEVISNTTDNEFRLFALFSDMFENDIINRVLRESEDDIELKESANVMLNTKVEHFGDDVECCICTDKIIKGEDVFVCECNNIIHYDCLDKWVRMKPSCPLCNRDLSKYIVNVYDEFDEWITSKLDF